MNIEVIEVNRLLAALALVVAANMMPWASGRLMRKHWAKPLDCGARLGDGTRLLGDHKTWRGVVAGGLGCALTARLLGYSWALGLVFAALSLTADLSSSFVKRRLHLAPGSEVVGLDQLPEALLPLLALAGPLGISVKGALVVASLFLCLDLIAMPLRRSLPADFHS
jgi:CDP-2,3-bis-(O-geranylgeranyl)-sn-glycerol synthase